MDKHIENEMESSDANCNPHYLSFLWAILADEGTPYF